MIVIPSGNYTTGELVDEINGQLVSNTIDMDISYNQLIAQISNLYKCRTIQHLQYDVSL